MDTEQLKILIDNCKTGRPGAFDKLIALYSDRCFGFLYRLSGNRHTAEDLLSELFIKLVEKIGSWDGGSFDNWVFTIAANLFKDHLRSDYRRKRLMQEKAELVQTEENFSEPRNDMEDKLHQALKRLEPEVAELILMRFYADLSFKEMAEKRNEPIGTTLCKMHRGLKKLREFMEIPENQRLL
jgi:RNA polymerase sigma-70 factor (ECF subfamily)